jgi:hypothetical protein
LFVESTAASPITVIAQCRCYLHSVDINNHIKDKQKRNENSHKASVENGTVEKVLFTLYTTNKSIEVIGKRKTIPENKKAVMRMWDIGRCLK